MNYRMIFYTTGKILQVNSLLLMLPAVVSLIYRESCVFSFLLAAVISVTVGFIISLIFKPKNHLIYAKEGFVIVSLTWILLSLIGALPFVLSGEIPFFFDAFFETVSGFTTTGASILTDIEKLSNGLLFWRSFTHWIGGMGVLVFVMAFIPNVSDRSIHLMRAEMPGPIVGKLVPRIRDTAKILYIIYIVLTLVEVVMLCAGGMSVFEGLLHSFGTAGTGGFGVKADSIGGYSPYIQWVIAIFMLIFGVNFNLYYLILIRRFRSAIKSSELWAYICIVLFSVSAISFNIYPMYKNIEEVLRQAAFQVSSIITTTGYATTDFNNWPVLSKGILMLLTISGGCAGSTAGGFKISRIVILFKMIRKEIRRLIHPHSVDTVKFEGKALDNQTLYGVGAYLAMYSICAVSIFLLLCIEPFDIETTLTAMLACFNNVGPGLGAVGPSSSFADFSAFSKLILSFAMLLGRLEIFPLIIALNPSTWKKR